MTPDQHAVQVMLPHFLKWLPLYPEYIRDHAIPAYFELCPWAKPLIAEQLRSAWKSLSERSAE